MMPPCCRISASTISRASISASRYSIRTGRDCHSCGSGNPTGSDRDFRSITWIPFPRRWARLVGEDFALGAKSLIPSGDLGVAVILDNHRETLARRLEIHQIAALDALGAAQSE